MAQHLGLDRVRCVLVYPRELLDEHNILVSGLTNGNGAFAGFQSLFRIPLEFVAERPLDIEAPRETITTVLVNDNPDLVLVIMPTKNLTLYAEVKSLLLGNGIPSQVVTAEVLRNTRGLPWTLENIALQ
ncbi:MAG: hypothetical protein QN208_09410, partial [Armatimonadota bacterium]|nr:hypothetical protein [Armatimonadota bacterium]